MARQDHAWVRKKHRLQSMKRLMVVGVAHLVMAGLAVTSTGHAKGRTSKIIARGAQIGVVNLLNAEVMHYHAAKDSTDSFLKIQQVSWPVDDMLTGALKDQLEQLGP
jgi:hypothetical protein